MNATQFLMLCGGGDGAPVTSPLAGRIRVEGKAFANDVGTFRPVFASQLAILSKPAGAWMAVLDESAALGFNGIRVFGGALTWAGLTAPAARAALPALLAAARDRDLYVFVSALTDSGTGYDVEGHLREVAAICNGAENAILCCANEPYHGSQSPQVNDLAWLLALARRVVPSGLPWALGAATVDEPIGDRYPTDGGTFNTAHLDRGRDKWNMVRRVREIENISAVTRKPAMSGEPIGAAEQAIGGKRESDPAVFFTLGALCRVLEVGGVFHSDDGLQAVQLRPNQRNCAEAYVAGGRAIDTQDRLVFKNAGWADSPVKSADFSRVVRAYSGVVGNTGWTVLVGISGPPALQWQGGWRPDSVVAEMPGVQILRLSR